MTDGDQRIVTGEAVAVELRPAGVGSRGVAVAIDFAAQLMLTFAWVFALSRTGATLDTATLKAVLLTLVVATLLGYPVGFETFWRGRTPGKAAMGLRAVRDDGGPLRFRHAFVRGLVGVVLDRLGISIGLLALIPMLMTRRSKRLGDLAAGTIVVQERVPARMAPPPAVVPELAGWAAALDLSAVTDQLAAEIRLFLGRASQLASSVRDELGNRLLAEVSTAVGALPPGMSPWTFLQTVLAERSRREAQRLSPARVTEVAHPPPRAEQPPQEQSLPPGPFAPPS